jgi:5-methyltetrahydrofolate--homocysteine methyltransferase
VVVKNRVVILDGAMGTMLQKRGMKTGESPELINLNNPELIVDIHRQYIEAGSEIIFTNTFGANREKLAGQDLDVIIKAALKNAKIAAEGTGTLVALDIGPIGELLEPMGTLKFEDAYDVFKEIIIAGKDIADLIVFETMTDLYEVKAAVLAAKENSNLPVFTTMTFEADMRTFTGVSLESYVNAIDGSGVSAIGLNCSLGSKEMIEMAKVLTNITDMDVIIKPNAGLPDMEGNYDSTIEEFVNHMEKIYELGVKYVGGCCGSNEKYISALSSRLKDREVISRKTEPISGPSSATKFISNDKLIIVGEGLNPTGKKRFQQALKKKDMEYIVNAAIKQADNGAEVLDLNAGYPGIDEGEIQEIAVKRIQSVLDTPIQIDSSKVEALERGLRVYNGKAIVNSVNGEKQKLDAILPLVKKYNAQVIGLTLDEKGIPNSAQERFVIAERIVEEALKHEIKKTDIYIDCLSLTVSSSPEQANETLKAIGMVKEKLGVKTALGVSNISFGLPNRVLLNNVFLAMALYSGLDLAIVNTNSKEAMDVISAFNVLDNRDFGAKSFIERFSGAIKPQEKTIRSYNLREAISKGLSELVSDEVNRLLKFKERLEIVDHELIPALDKVGKDYEEGVIFLPQLIRSAEAAQVGFEIIQNKIAESDKKSLSKGDILIATVKGDVHDIGKNIVKVVLKSYGYNVIDLGKDVDIQTVVNQTMKNNIKLVGLSALMTTTVENMKDTIKALRTNVPDVKIMVGGAVLTQEHSIKIGADFYAKDAKQGVEVARRVFGGDYDKKS